MGDCISLDGKDESCLFQGRVVDIEGACLEVWSDNADGFYDVQQPDLQPKWNNRGRFVTGSDGPYEFVSIKPTSYPIPDDGLVGMMLSALGRHPYGPAHMHFLVTASGFQRIVTHTFVGDNKYRHDDAVFGVRSLLVAPFEKSPLSRTEWVSKFDFVMTQT